jgi:carbamoylphosphate synthase large subunit
MMLAAKRIASRLELSGFFGLDFMIEDRSGHTYLIEMNPRSTLLCHLPLGPGRDMIAPLFAKLSGHPLRDTSSVTQNDMIAYFPLAWQCKSKFLQSSFQDVPQGEPELVQDLLHPWPDRSLLYRAAAKLYDFAAAIAKRRVPEHGAPEL